VWFYPTHDGEARREWGTRAWGGGVKQIPFGDDKQAVVGGHKRRSLR
jgi:hypothetical protein